MVRLCVFDCDGTLVDSQHAIIACMADAFAAAGRPAPADAAVRHVVGLSLRDAISVLAGDADDNALTGLATGYSDAFARMRAAGNSVDPLYPGVLAGLDELEAAGWLLGMATGKSQRGAHMTLRLHGLSGRFVTVQTPDVAAGKPGPDMLLRAMDETGAAPAATVMIGDTVYDMEMARNARTLALAVAWGYHDAGDLVAAGAHAVVHAFADIPAAVNDLMERAPETGAGRG